MRSQLIQLIYQILKPLQRKMQLMISRCVLKLVDDSLKCQGLQVSLLSDELRDDVERFQEYGFTSVPYSDAEGIFVSVGANRSHGVVVATEDRRYRPKNLNAGDVCLYTDAGERVYLDKDNDIVNIGAKAAAEFIAMADKVLTELNDIKTAFDAHIHTTTATIGPSAVLGIISPPTVAMPAPNSVAATKAKVT